MLFQVKKYQRLPGARREAEYRFFLSLQKAPTLPRASCGTKGLQECDRKNHCCFKPFPSNGGNVKRRRFKLWATKIPWRRAWQPTPVFMPGECHGKRSLVATVHRAAVGHDRGDSACTHGMMEDFSQHRLVQGRSFLYSLAFKSLLKIN